MKENLLFVLAQQLRVFSKLPIKKAVRPMTSDSGGVQLDDWPTSVQTEMSEGKIVRPDGQHPEHRNV